jgi:predicted aminopeptidase
MMPPLPRHRRAFGLGAGALLAGWFTLTMPGCGIGYLAQQGYFQAELLAGRKPIAGVMASGELTPAEVNTLSLVPKIKDFGRKIGLAATENYDTINPGWRRTIWNVSACEPLAFRPKTYWFPIVGSVPYLGYFREDDARERARELHSEGYDVYVRTAGAYSTLGWFRDPVLRSMLRWDEGSLAETLLHELAHATLWIQGSVQFNESFANFVGEEASLRYVADTYGAESEPMKRLVQSREDSKAFRRMLHAVYEDLDRVYRDGALTDETRKLRKAAILSSIPDRTRALGLHDAERYLRSAQSGEWNNARLMQFRTYNRSPEWFAKLLDQERGDLSSFIRRIDEITEGADDPYAALEAATR